MKKKNTIFDFWSQVFFMYGITIAILIALCRLFGENAREISSMFSLGRAGISLTTMIEFLAVSILITGARFFCFNDAILKKASITVRTILMLFTIIVIMAVFICVFGWFPVNMWEPWMMFLICFGICFLVSAVITYLKEKTENRNMEKALEELKEKIE